MQQIFDWIIEYPKRIENARNRGIFTPDEEELVLAFHAETKARYIAYLQKMKALQESKGNLTDVADFEEMLKSFK